MFSIVCLLSSILHWFSFVLAVSVYHFWYIPTFTRKWISCAMLKLFCDLCLQGCIAYLLIYCYIKHFSSKIMYIIFQQKLCNQFETHNIWSGNIFLLLYECSKAITPVKVYFQMQYNKHLWKHLKNTKYLPIAARLMSFFNFHGSILNKQLRI